MRKTVACLHRIRALICALAADWRYLHRVKSIPSMAGIGGNLICELLGKICKKIMVVFQIHPAAAPPYRQTALWLYDNGFSITNEQLVREGKFICEVLTVVPKEMLATRQMNVRKISSMNFRG